MGIITSMERRASPENPSTSLANPAAWFTDWATGGGRTRAGVSINNSNALGLSAVYAAVRRISDDVAKLPLHTFERLDRGRRKAVEHHLYGLLKDRPNPVMTSYVFWEVLMGHLLTWGNGYAEIERDNAGRVVALWPLRPDRMRVEWTGTRKVFVYKDAGGEAVPFRQEEVLHIPGFGFDGLVGYNPIRLARESLGLTKAAEQFGASFYGNGSRASGVLRSPQKLSDEAFERLRQSWEDQHRGPDNAHRIAILEEGLDWTQIGIPPEEGQFLESRKFQVEEVARWYQITPHKIGDLSHATYSNVEHQGQEYLNDTIQPWVERIERAVNWELFPDSDRGLFYARFMIQALLRPDSQARGDFYNKLFNVGALSPNDILEMEERNPVAGGDQRFVPLNMVPLELAGTLTDGTPLDPDGGDDARRAPAAHTAVAPPGRVEAADGLSQAQRRSVSLRRRQMLAQHDLFRDTAQRVLNRELIQARRALKNSFGARDQQSFRAWLDEFYETHNEFVAEQFQPVVAAFADAIYATAADEMGADQEMSAETERQVEQYAAVLGVRWAASSRRQLAAILRDTPAEEVEAALTQRLNEWEEKRADKVAGREPFQLGNAVSKWAYIAAGALSIRWVTVGEDCPYCQQLDGRVISTSDAFVQEGASVDPNDDDKEPMLVRSSISHPPLHRGCDCVLVAA